MDQTDKSAQGQKPKIYKLAIISPLVVILGFLVGLVFGGWLKYIPLLSDLGLFVYLVSPVVGLVLGIIADRKIYKSKGILKGRVFSILGTGLAIIIIVLWLIPMPPRRIPDRIVCGHHLHQLGKLMQAYSDRYDQRYPIKNMWCDLLVEHADVNEITYVCRGALENGDQGRCHYAINPNCGPNSPNDVVLLFETKGGWNQFGGPELLTFENHKGKGCNVLFNGEGVVFIKPEDVNGLKWATAQIEPPSDPRPQDWWEPELPANFVWSNHSTTPLEQHVSADYWNVGDKYWVVLRYEGKGQIGHMDEIVLLCLKEEQLECWSHYQLDSGLVVGTLWLKTRSPTTITRLRLLKDEFFRGENDGEMKFFYNGKVSGSGSPMVYIVYDSGTDRNWLRFEVVAKKNKQKVISTVEKLYPPLEKEPDARDVVACLTPLLSEKDKQKQ